MDSLVRAIARLSVRMANGAPWEADDSDNVAIGLAKTLGAMPTVARSPTILAKKLLRVCRELTGRDVVQRSCARKGATI